MDDELAKRDTPTVFIGHLPNKTVDSVQFDYFGGGYIRNCSPRALNALKRGFATDFLRG
jgi:hypothetical protein